MLGDDASCEANSSLITLTSDRLTLNELRGDSITCLSSVVVAAILLQVHLVPGLCSQHLSGLSQLARLIPAIQIGSLGSAYSGRPCSLHSPCDEPLGLGFFRRCRWQHRRRGIWCRPLVTVCNQVPNHRCYRHSIWSSLCATCSRRNLVAHFFVSPDCELAACPELGVTGVAIAGGLVDAGPL